MSEPRGYGQTLLALVTLLVTVVGAGVAFLEYRHAQQRERIERVFGYSDRLAGQADANARISKLSDDFLLLWPSLAQSLGPDAKDSDIEKLANDWFIGAINGDPALRSAVEQMAQFYDTLAVCVTQNLCDEPTAKALFMQNVASFASTAYPWVAHRNKEYFAATGTQALCLRNRFCGGETECAGLPKQLAPCQ